MTHAPTWREKNLHASMFIATNTIALIGLIPRIIITSVNISFSLRLHHQWLGLERPDHDHGSSRSVEPPISVMMQLHIWMQRAGSCCCCCCSNPVLAVVVTAIAIVIVISILVIAVSILLFAKRDLRQALTSIVLDAHAAHSFGARAAS